MRKVQHLAWAQLCGRILGGTSDSLTGAELCHGGATASTGGRDTVGHAAAVLYRASTAVMLAWEGKEQGNKTIQTTVLRLLL